MLTTTEIMPQLKIGWLNGWWAIFLLGLTEGIFFALFPKQVVARLFDRSGWSRKQVAFITASKLIGVGCLLVLVLTPLKIGRPIFVIGTILLICGLAGLMVALIDFKNTPLDQPVTRGIYRLSRHPQIVMSSLVLLGGCIAIGSWLASGLWVVARLLGHWGILAEEEVCLKRYGSEYQEYMNKVPRYFLLI